MTDSVRKQIRDAIETLLVAAGTDAGSNIYQHRTLSLEDAVLPAINIITGNETSERLTMGMSSSLLDRELEVRIECYTKSDATPTPDPGNRAEDRVLIALDALSADVEVAMAADTTLGGLAKDSYLVSTRMESDSDNSVANEAGVITLEYMVHYQTRRNTPTTAN